MTSLIQRGKIRRTHTYTKGEDQTDNSIYYKIEQEGSTKKGGISDGHIYILRGRSDGHVYIP